MTGLSSGFALSGYQVLIYQSADSAGSFGYTVTDNAGHAITAYGQQTSGSGNYPLADGTDGFVGSTSTDPAGPGSAANYVMIAGLTGTNFTITGNQGSTGEGRVRPNGFQIASVPETSSYVLIAAGGVALALWRRRFASR